MHTKPSPDTGAPGLPVQLTRFIGREREISAVRQTLGTSRLLTLTGAAGSGKTRLALEVAAQVAGDYTDGVTWVELATLTHSELLPQHLAATLGVREEAVRPATTALLDALCNRAVLIVLDNCEHLADACAALVETLLRGCAGLSILTTSREALGVAGERAWLVPPLTLPASGGAPDVAALLAAEAVQLFVARAQDVVPSFTLREQNAPAVVQICRRLDGLPLAIELAAARVKVLTPEQIAERLDNAFALLTSGSRRALPRHRTLRATIDWSYQLLSAPEQLLLQRLSVFAGGFTLDAAEAVCADERLEASQVLDLLARLVDRSLVVMRERDGVARYHLLETVRQYAAERFTRADDAAATRRRHADFYVAFTEFAEPHVYMGGTDRRWLERVDNEIGNVRAAAEWFDRDEAGAEPALRLATSLRWYWYQRDTAEGRRQIDRALARRTPSLPRVRGRALMALGAIAYWQGDVPGMAAPLAEAVQIARSLGDEVLLAEALNWTALGRADPTYLESSEGASEADDETGAMMQEALALGRRIGGPLLVQTASSAGYIAHQRGDFETARERALEATELAQSLGLQWAATTIATNLGRLAYVQGDLDAAALHWHESLGLELEMQQRWSAPFAVEGLALVAFARGDAHRAARLLGAAEVVRARIGSNLRSFDDADRPVIERLRATLGESLFAVALAEGRALNADQAIAFAAASARTPAPAGHAIAATPATIAPAPSPRLDATSSPVGLRVAALGPLTIEREGEVLPAETWPYAKPKELLLFLLRHPEGRTREQIGLAFWPEASAAQVKNSFHVTLHHLRKALGHADWVVFENERYRISPDLTVEFDAALFEQQMTLALRNASAGSGSIEALRGALAYYHGDFLQDEPAGDWHLEIRDHLRRLYSEGLFALGELLMRAEAFAEAAEVYQQLVRKEDLHEEAHRRLMLCLARSGERGRALRHYERLVVLLREELEAAPEEETAALYERLKASPHTSQPA